MGMNPPRDDWGKDCCMTVADLKRYRAKVRAFCDVCHGEWPVDLHVVSAAAGDTFRLIQHRPRCRTRQCQGRLRFLLKGFFVPPEPSPGEPVRLVDHQARRMARRRS